MHPKGQSLSSSNVNHLKELQLVKQREQEMKVMRSYSDTNNYFYSQQPVYWQNPVSTPQMPPAQTQMMYYPPQPQPQYIMAPNQYYSPPASMQYYPQRAQTFKKATKEIKLKRKNTDFFPKSYKKDLGSSNNSSMKTIPSELSNKDAKV